MDKIIHRHGITIEFDSNTNNYAKNVNIKWYQNSTLLDEADYVVDSAIYFCDRKVTAFNKIIITMNNTNIPYRYLKIFNIIDGIIRNFYEDEIENLEILEEISSNTSALAINNASIEIKNKNEIGILFQRTLPCKVYKDEDLYGVFFIDQTTTNNNRSVYKISANDYIGLLEYQTHFGGMYNNETVSNIVADILTDIEYELDSDLGSRTISGYLPIQTKREALRQVIFSVCGVIDTTRTDKIIIKKLSNEIISTKNEEDITSYSVNDLAITTQIDLTIHRFIANSTSTELYKNTLNGTLLVTFDQPMHDLSITNGTIVESNANYAIITGTGLTVTLSGQGYDENTETISKNNTNISSTDLSKAVNYNTNLIWNNETLLASLKFIKQNISAVMKLEDEKVGDLITMLGIDARILQIDYDLSLKNMYAKVKLEVYDEQN